MKIYHTVIRFLLICLVISCAGSGQDTQKQKEALRLWQGIPIMNGAQFKQKTQNSCLYTISLPVGDVERFYLISMARKGFQNSTRRRSQVSSVGGGPLVSLNFVRSGSQVNVTIIYKLKEKHSAVMIHQF